MAKASRDKGKRGEREFASLLRSLGFNGARRTAQYCGNTGSADDVVGVDGFHIEVKRCETVRLHDWIKQAAHDCGQNVPVVAHRRNGEPWYVTLAAGDFFKIVKEAQDAHQE